MEILEMAIRRINVANISFTNGESTREVRAKLNMLFCVFALWTWMQLGLGQVVGLGLGRAAPLPLPPPL